MKRGVFILGKVSLASKSYLQFYRTRNKTQSDWRRSFKTLRSPSSVNLVWEGHRKKSNCSHHFRLTKYTYQERFRGEQNVKGWSPTGINHTPKLRTVVIVVPDVGWYQQRQKVDLEQGTSVIPSNKLAAASSRHLGFSFSVTRSQMFHAHLPDIYFRAVQPAKCCIFSVLISPYGLLFQKTLIVMR